jgi:hypothetical protein
LSRSASCPRSTASKGSAAIVAGAYRQPEGRGLVLQRSDAQPCGAAPRRSSDSATGGGLLLGGRH